MAGMTIIITPGDDVLRRYSNQIGAIGEGKAQAAMGRAINRTVDMVYTQTVRVLVRQTSAPRSVVVASMRKKYASTSGGALEGMIIAKGRELPLKMFKPVQFKAGTKATVWGKRQLFKGAFMGPRPGAIALALKGHVWTRTSEARLPIKKMFGPSIPKEMVKDQSAAQFESMAPPILARRLEHEIGRMLPK
jgi:hypothetical protein